MNGWKPIGTAPKDGSRMLVVWLDQVEIATWNREVRNWQQWPNGDFDSGGEITDWMPLPTPPDESHIAIPMLKYLWLPGDTTKYGMDGFNEVDEWGRLHDLTWSKLTKECEQLGLQPDDRVRFLATALLREKHGQLGG